MQYTRLEGLVLGSVLAALGDGLVIPKMQELGSGEQPDDDDDDDDDDADDGDDDHLIIWSSGHVETLTIVMAHIRIINALVAFAPGLLRPDDLWHPGRAGDPGGRHRHPSDRFGQRAAAGGHAVGGDHLWGHQWGLHECHLGFFLVLFSYCSFWLKYVDILDIGRMNLYIYIYTYIYIPKTVWQTWRSSYGEC